MVIGILQPGYLPWLGFFEQMQKTDLFVILDDVQYDKKSWRNRNRIRTKDGWMWLTVPVKTKNLYHQQIKDVNIDNTIPWKKKHLKAIEINYSKAPFFGDYIDTFRKAYSSDGPDRLLDLDMMFIEIIKDSFEINTPIIMSSSLNIAKNRSEKIVEICQKVGASKLYDGAAAVNFIDLELFKESAIDLEFQNYEHPVYAQLFEPFIPYMSAIDLLFNHGPQSKKIFINDNKLS